jgi:short-subunit dehydrogenase
MASSESRHSRPLAVVTGASSGIGYELARQFAHHGFDLLICAEDTGITEAAKAVADGGLVESLQVDLASYDGVEKLYAKIQSLGRPVDAIAINAGVGVGGGFVETKLEDELNLIHLNVTSAVHLAKRVARDMLKRGIGRILFTSSIAAVLPAPFEAVYGASKAFLQSFSEALRNELADAGITVTALMAGKDKVVAGSIKNKLMAAASRVLPDSAKTQMHRRMSEPSSGTEPDSK